MISTDNINPAEKASIECFEKVITVLNSNKNFLVEAGAGAGKTYTLIKTLKYLIHHHGNNFLQKNKKIACITYTNVAKEEIKSRTDNHPIIFSETIHAFGWQVIKDFQKNIREQITKLSDKWKQRVEESVGLKGQEIIYNLGYPKITEKEIFLHHDDVIKLLIFLLDDSKFQKLIYTKYPVIFIDEYQDTNKDLADAIVRNFIEPQQGPLIGFFGDHWQTIYGSSSCGLIKASSDGKLQVIGKQANFRSDKLIVTSLNRIRPELEQHESNPKISGEIIIYHSNDWQGNRRNGGHWKDDLPEDIAHEYLNTTTKELVSKGWEIKPETTKILMLTNSVLASEQGYRNIFATFNDTDEYLKKNNDYISFLADIVEVGSEAFEIGKYGEMLSAFKLSMPKIRKHSEKEIWHRDMLKLMELRKNGTIGDVIDLLKETYKPKLSKNVYDKEFKFKTLLQLSEDQRSEEDTQFLEKIKAIRAIPYSELINVTKYIDEKTLFSTKHGVKGAEFENVIVILGRGWNHYNWNQMLEWVQDGVPKDKNATFERNRNLFYVACSRPKKRLALLFTQRLSDKAIITLKQWFGNVIMPINL